jgi:hypothetical protein
LLHENINKQTGLPQNQCKYCMYLADFYTDDTSPWVLSSVHIQRSGLFFPAIAKRLSNKE